MKKVKDFMNKNVIYFKPEDTVFDVARVFSRKHISGAPVVKNKKVVGIVSTSDIAKYMSSKLGYIKPISQEIVGISFFLLKMVETGKGYWDMKKEAKKISQIRVEDVMSKKIISIKPNETLFDAANMMEKYDVNRLPVINNNRLVGIISRADLIRALIC